jgi:hypothetical protein
MNKRLLGGIVVAVCVVAVPLVAISQSTPNIQPWNNPGLGQGPSLLPAGTPGPAPRRNLTGIWDPGRAGIGGGGHQSAPLTAYGEDMGKRHKAGNGSRMAGITEINDPLSTLGDPAGFPRLLLFEFRPVQIVQTPREVLMLYMFEKRWRNIWTDGRKLPADPDPRWYGYSVGRWEDDFTFVVDTIGMTDRTWLDNSGNPHSNELRVEERYHRVNVTTMELTVTIHDPKIYQAPWTPRNKMVLTLLPPDIDLAEMIPSASEAARYRSVFAEPSQ